MNAFAPAINAKAPSTTFKEVSGKLVAALPFPLPPLAEQQRIVAKVDELMALCSELEGARIRRESARDALATATLARLREPDSAATVVARDARFALDALPVIMGRPGQTRPIRQAILNLAVRGRLVPQDPNEERAEEALARIAAERADLTSRDGMRREKPLRPVTAEELPFAIPENWMWVRLGSAVLFTQYGTSQKAERIESGVPVLTMGNIQDGAVKSQNEKKIPTDAKDLPALFLRKYDLLYNRTNSAELVGKTGIYLGEDGVHTFASYLIRLRPSLASSDARYLNLAMNAPVFRETQVVPLIKKQTGQANVNGTALKNMLIPLPPLPEQHRIVLRVDELMELCDRLEAQMSVAQLEGGRFLESVLDDALKHVDADQPAREGLPLEPVGAWSRGS